MNTEPHKPMAWMHEDGRVVRAETMEHARQGGGAMLSSLAGYTIPLYGPDALDAARERCIPDVDEFAQHIRWLNGSNKMGAGTLAEKLVEWMRSRA